MVLYRALADLVLVLHATFIVFVVAGGLLALRWRWAPYAHLPAVAWGVYIELSGRVCPLTPLENTLRRAAGEAGYAGGFLEHYLVRVVYPPGLTPRIQLGLAILLILANVAIYAVVVRRRLRGPEKAQGG